MEYKELRDLKDLIAKFIEEGNDPQLLLKEIAMNTGFEAQRHQDEEGYFQYRIYQHLHLTKLAKVFHENGCDPEYGGWKPRETLWEVMQEHPDFIKSEDYDPEIDCDPAQADAQWLGHSF